YAFRIIVSSVDDCYRVLGVVHRTFKMIRGEFDDYISSPKPNGYQSIHTAVLAAGEGHQGQRVEIQIRSAPMHEIAEHGVAAHWRYKDVASQQVEGSTVSVEMGVDGKYSAYDWLRGVIETLNSGEGKEEFLAQAKIDLYQDQVFPFTPKGRVIPLPRGATALDFAYALHTEVGDNYSGAKINGVQRPNRTPLRNGDVVHILKSENAPIPTGWETFAVTGGAKSGVRRRIRDLRKKEQAALGERIVTSAFAARDLPYNQKAVDEAAEKLSLSSAEEVFGAVGRMDISGQLVVETVFPDLDKATAGSGSRSVGLGSILPYGAVSLDGVTPGAAVELARCCGPLPGERIVGVQGKGRGVVAHRIECSALIDHQDQEWLNLKWDADHETEFVVPIFITVNNRTGALGHIGTMLARYGADIMDLRLEDREIDFSNIHFDVLVRDARHLSNVLTGLRASDYVVSAERRDDTDDKLAIKLKETSYDG
ncbi:MAG: RelA/SpoT AH/RIS domain-containing protein, partial [Pseudomonadota bacterium]